MVRRMRRVHDIMDGDAMGGGGSLRRHRGLLDTCVEALIQFPDLEVCASVGAVRARAPHAVPRAQHIQNDACAALGELMFRRKDDFIVAAMDGDDDDDRPGDAATLAVDGVERPLAEFPLLLPAMLGAMRGSRSKDRDIVTTRLLWRIAAGPADGSAAAEVREAGAALEVLRAVLRHVDSKRLLLAATGLLSVIVPAEMLPCGDVASAPLPAAAAAAAAAAPGATGKPPGVPLPAVHSAAHVHGSTGGGGCRNHIISRAPPARTAAASQSAAAATVRGRGRSN